MTDRTTLRSYLCSALLLTALAGRVSAQAAPNPLWIEQWGLLNASSGVRSTATDGAGGAYVVWTVSGGGYWLLSRRDGAGTEVWTQDLAPYLMRSVGPDEAGGALVTGKVGVDAEVRRLDGAGNLVWTYRYSPSYMTSTFAQDAVPDRAGGFLVAGTVTSGGVVPGDEFWGILARIDASGVESWLTELRVPGERIKLTGVVPDGLGGAFCVGSGTQFELDPAGEAVDRGIVCRFDAQGNLSWLRQVGTSDGLLHASALASDGSGGVVVAGDVASTGVPYGYLARHDSTGSELWFTPIGDAVLARGVALHGADLYVCGRDFGFGFVSRHDLTGARLWQSTFGGPPFGTLAQDLFVDSSSDLFVAGSTGVELGAPQLGIDAFLARYALEPVGTGYCGPAQPNSTGAAASIEADGDARVAVNDLTLNAVGMPAGRFGYFLASLTQGNSPNPGGSQGTLCLAGAIGRYTAPGQVQAASFAGGFYLELDLARMPTPMGTTGAVAGQAWSFQAWYRDVNPGPTSNFTDAVQVVLQ